MKTRRHLPLQTPLQSRRHSAKMHTLEPLGMATSYAKAVDLKRRRPCHGACLDQAGTHIRKRAM